MINNPLIPSLVRDLRRIYPRCQRASHMVTRGGESVICRAPFYMSHLPEMMREKMQHAGLPSWGWECTTRRQGGSLLLACVSRDVESIRLVVGVASGLRINGKLQHRYCVRTPPRQSLYRELFRVARYSRPTVLTDLTVASDSIPAVGGNWRFWKIMAPGVPHRNEVPKPPPGSLILKENIRPMTLAYSFGHCLRMILSGSLILEEDDDEKNNSDPTTPIGSFYAHRLRFVIVLTPQNITAPDLLWWLAERHALKRPSSSNIDVFVHSGCWKKMDTIARRTFLSFLPFHEVFGACRYEQVPLSMMCHAALKTILCDRPLVVTQSTAGRDFDLWG